MIESTGPGGPDGVAPMGRRAARLLASGALDRTLGAPGVDRRLVVLISPARASRPARSSPRRSTQRASTGWRCSVAVPDRGGLAWFGWRRRPSRRASVRRLSRRQLAVDARAGRAVTRATPGRTTRARDRPGGAGRRARLHLPGLRGAPVAPLRDAAARAGGRGSRSALAVVGVVLALGGVDLSTPTCRSSGVLLHPRLGARSTRSGSSLSARLSGERRDRLGERRHRPTLRPRATPPPRRP